MLCCIYLIINIQNLKKKFRNKNINKYLIILLLVIHFDIILKSKVY